MSKSMLCFRQEIISLDLNITEVGTKAKIMKMLTDQILCNRCTLGTIESDYWKDTIKTWSPPKQN